MGLEISNRSNRKINIRSPAGDNRASFTGFRVMQPGMPLVFKKRKKMLTDICEGEWFFCDRLTDEIELDTWLITTVVCF